MKRYLLGMVILSTVIGCTPKEDKVNLDNIKDVREEVNQMAEDNQSVNNFFANEEYDSKEEKQCVENNIGTLQGLAYCSEKNIKIIKENIKKKLKSLNKPENILETEYKKIKDKCTKETIQRIRKDGYNEKNEAPLVNSSIAVCIEYELYQFGRKLK